MTHAWDAPVYDRVSNPLVQWGDTVVARLALDGDERVLDAGCGTGRVTELLLARLPRGHVVALDGSPAMLVEAQRRLAASGDRVEFVHADLRLPLPVRPAVDAIFSTATFHWIADHDALFEHLAAVLRPGGALVAQFGGDGNIGSVRAAIAASGDDWAGPWNFATVEATRSRLSAAGFSTSDVWLKQEAVHLERGGPLEEFLRSVVLGAHLERLPVDEREAYVQRVADLMPEPTIDYVRLNITARL